MKKILKNTAKVFLLVPFIILSACVNTAVKQTEIRQIALVQQENPGELIFVSVFDFEDGPKVAVTGMGKLSMEKQFPISEADFNELFVLSTSPYLDEFKYTAGKGESVSHPSFYTFTIQGLVSEKHSLRIPRDTNNKTALRLLEFMQSYIGK